MLSGYVFKDPNFYDDLMYTSLYSDPEQLFGLGATLEIYYY